MYRRLPSNPTAAQLAHDDLLTADEVAALLRMTPAWVYSETRRNRIPHLRLGRYFRYRRSAIQAWMGDLESGPEPPAGRDADSLENQNGGKRGRRKSRSSHAA